MKNHKIKIRIVKDERPRGAVVIGKVLTDIIQGKKFWDIRPPKVNKYLEIKKLSEKSDHLIQKYIHDKIDREALEMYSS